MRADPKRIPVKAALLAALAAAALIAVSATPAAAGGEGRHHHSIFHKSHAKAHHRHHKSRRHHWRRKSVLFRRHIRLGLRPYHGGPLLAYGDADVECRGVKKAVRISHARKALLRATGCYDADGNFYIVPGSTYVVRYLH